MSSHGRKDKWSNPDWLAILSNPKIQTILRITLLFRGRFKLIDLRKALEEHDYKLKPSSLARYMKKLESIRFFNHDTSPTSEYERWTPCEDYKDLFPRILLPYDMIDNMSEANRLYNETEQNRSNRNHKDKINGNPERLLKPPLWEALSHNQRQNVMKWFVDFHMDS